MVRYLPLQGNPSQPGPLSSLPALADVKPLGTTWLLHLRTLVQDASPAPERINAALELLQIARRDLLGVFDFRYIDRLVHDTRIAGPAASSSMPVPLPQVVTVGRGV
jgi:mediator of RNA polymerase II transcription subunit 18